jgi:nucleotide-binding universal stress UspA family protein
LVTGATTEGVAGRTRAPSIVVPAEWSPRDEPGGRVVVGVKDAEHADALLAAAFAHAARCGAEIQVIHAWRLPDAYADRVELRTHADAWVAEGQRAVSAALAGWTSAYPDVPVKIDVVHGDPADALVKASADADLLLVLRRSPRFLGPHLGHVARGVLRAAECPVGIVPDTDASVSPDEPDGAD